jgi:hypothetical protein
MARVYPKARKAFEIKCKERETGLEMALQAVLHKARICGVRVVQFWVLPDSGSRLEEVDQPG